MNNILKTILIVSGISASIGFGFAAGYFVSKRNNSPKTIEGELYINHTEDEKHPYIYLNNVDPKIFKSNDCFVVFKTKHIRK